MKILRASDFAIFVFSPDDVSVMRDNTDKVVRDNVLFELGLFIGRLGPERCFFLVPDSQTMRLPTDLFGVNPTKYESGRSDANWEAAVNPACMQIQRAINQLKPFQDIVSMDATSRAATLPELSAQKVVNAASPSPTSKLTLEPYKKSVLLKGDTIPYIERLKALKYPSYNRTLDGWVIPRSKEALARTDLADLL